MLLTLSPSVEPQQVALEKEDQKHLLRLERDEVDVLDPRQRALRRARHGRVLGDGSHRHRDPLDHALDVARGGLQLVVDVSPHTIGNRLEIHQEVDEVAVPGIGRHPPRRGVRLGQVPQVGQLGELAPDRGRRKIHEVTGLQRL